MTLMLVMGVAFVGHYVIGFLQMLMNARVIRTDVTRTALIRTRVTTVSVMSFMSLMLMDRHVTVSLFQTAVQLKSYHV